MFETLKGYATFKSIRFQHTNITHIHTYSLRQIIVSFFSNIYEPLANNSNNNFTVLLASMALPTPTQLVIATQYLETI